MSEKRSKLVRSKIRKHINITEDKLIDSIKKLPYSARCEISKSIMGKGSISHTIQMILIFSFLTLFWMGAGGLIYHFFLKN